MRNNEDWKKDLDCLLNARAIAVVGASEKVGPGRNTVYNLLHMDYKGRIYPINPSRKTVFEQKCFPSLAELPEKPDLAVIAFGMNDGSTGVKTCTYIWNLLKIMAAVRAENPRCEFILIATSLPNPLSSFATGMHEAYRPWVLRLGQKGVAVTDLTRLHRDMLAHKRFEDFNSNNINHPNDFFARVYAQALMETLKQ